MLFKDVAENEEKRMTCQKAFVNAVTMIRGTSVEGVNKSPLLNHSRVGWVTSTRVPGRMRAFTNWLNHGQT